MKTLLLLNHHAIVSIAALFLLGASGSVLAQQGTDSFYPNGTYMPGIPTPETVLNFPLGSCPTRYNAVVNYCRTLAEKSPFMKWQEIGETYEHRKLFYLVISSAENLARLSEIKQINEEASSRRGGTEVDSIPAVVWIGCGIHGDELSSVDAALRLAYQLAAGTDEATISLRTNLVICLDPIQNPDGRERFLAQMESWNGPVLNVDMQSLQHTGQWPWGRGNHYLYDMNRDLFALELLESQARVRAITSWHPHVLIDAHEMGALDTYLFSPPREPINSNVSSNSRKWWKIFSQEQAKAFDRYGWSYYTREWNDDFFPGYLNSWISYHDGIGILYEQAGVDGSAVKRPDGSVLTYRECVHHHFVSLISNLLTAAGNKNEITGDYRRMRKIGITLGKDEPKLCFIVPGKNQSRAERLIDKLLLQHIAVGRLGQEYNAVNVFDLYGERSGSKTMPAGTFVIALDQPNGRIAKAILETDPRMSTSFLQEERKSLEKNKNSKLYDVTSWSLLLANDIDAYWSIAKQAPSTIPVKELPPASGSLRIDRPGYGYVFSCEDDRSVELTKSLLEKGYVVRAGKEPFAVNGQKYGRGAILLRINENRSSLSEDVQSLAAQTGMPVLGVSSAMSQDGPDLGGNDFVLLKEPRVLLIGGPEVNTGSFGAVWHLLDYRLHMKMSMISAPSFGLTDLAKYNVIIMPSGVYQRVLGKENVNKLREWVEAGGTCIALGDAAAFLADTATGLSQVRLRHQNLKDVNLYSKAESLEHRAMMPHVDSLIVWEGKPRTEEKPKMEKSLPPDLKELELEDTQGQLFMPRGAILKVMLDEEHWMNFGVGEKIPAMVYTSNVFLSKKPVQTPGRFSDAEHLRLSGLLWPEARERWAKSAYATCEGKGKGQIILFAGEPNFRGAFHGTERLFLNSIFFGPGFGTSSLVPW